MGALKLCQTATAQDERQALYAFRTGVVFHRLAKLYDDANQRAHNDTAVADTANTNSVNYDPTTMENVRKKTLQLAKMYYEKSQRQFEELAEPKEYLLVICDRVKLLNRLGEGMSFWQLFYL